jgi:sterol 3beta-glucosyltransferase
MRTIALFVGPMLTTMRSQPFWGDMVAAVGAGPRPVHHKSLNQDDFIAIIQTLLDARTKRAAEGIAMKMRGENGVQFASESFHRNLPQTQISCELLPDQSAVWTYATKARKPGEKKKSKMELRLSSKAVAVLSHNKLLDLSKLKLLVSHCLSLVDLP